MDFLFTPSVPTLIQQFADFNLSYPCQQDLNLTASSSSSPNFGLSYFTMLFGIISNLTGLAVLSSSYARFHRRAKTPFLLLASSLLLTDLTGQMVTGAFALHLYLEKVKIRREATRTEPHEGLCNLFGACMVYFGLCPLLLGSAMAVERCLGITQPLQHSAMATIAHVRFAVILLIAIAFLIATLPLLHVGTYKPQFPGTWCFLPIHGKLSHADASLALVFSSLGLVALIIALLCNTVSWLTLLQARFGSQGQKTFSRRNRSSTSSTLHSLDIEMMVQLVVITVVSCVCWSPFLICISVSVRHFYKGYSKLYQHYEQQFLLGLRMASWNQILDPWVYILLRRAVLRRVYGLLHPNRFILSQSSSCTGLERQENNLQ